MAPLTQNGRYRHWMAGLGVAVLGVTVSLWLAWQQAERPDTLVMLERMRRILGTTVAGATLDAGLKAQILELPSEDLLADLALHRLDVVLADRPGAVNPSLKVYSHAIGTSPVAWYAPPSLVAAARRVRRLAAAPAVRAQARVGAPGPAVRTRTRAAWPRARSRSPGRPRSPSSGRPAVSIEGARPPRQPGAGTPA